MKGKEIAKFLSGFAVNQVLTHGAFAASGVEFNIFGVLYDRGLNTGAVLFWAGAAIVLIYLGWIRR